MEALQTLTVAQLIAVLAAMFAAFRGLEWLVNLLIAKTRGTEVAGVSGEELLRLLQSDKLKVCAFEHRALGQKLDQQASLVTTQTQEAETHFKELSERVARLQRTQEGMLQAQEEMTTLTSRLQQTVRTLGETLVTLSEQQSTTGRVQSTILSALARIEKEITELRQQMTDNGKAR